MKSTQKWSKMLLSGMAAMVLAFGLVVTGCPMDADGDAYTLEFRVRNSVGISAISKIEFFNGSNENAPLLKTEMVNLTEGQMSSTIKVSGFTEKQGDDNHIFGVKVTTPWGNTHFDWSSATDGSKVSV
ncbi:hypothetical protein FACS1894190_04400 [Spirochaetia bacterium]|nr:hypothetical protein FACS1894190_04400 [Spirochaetia bacterium]